MRAGESLRVGVRSAGVSGSGRVSEPTGGNLRSLLPPAAPH